MQTLATTFVVMLLSGPAIAGHQPNPLPIFGADNRQYEIQFSSEGLVFEGLLYKRIGPNRYEAFVEPEACQQGQLGVEVGRLQLRRREIRWTWTRYEGCRRRGVAPRILDVSRRYFSRDKTSGTKKCVSGTREYTHKSRVVRITDTCDGRLEVAHGLDRFVVGRHSARARYQGRGRLSDRPWKLTIRPRSREKSLRISGSVKELRGTWTRATPVP